MKLFQEVKNVPELRKDVLSGSLNCCIIKPSLIVDPFQVVVAANKAVVAEKTTTKSVNTELLFNLSPSKNITQSLQKFGVQDGDTEVLVAVIGDSEDVFKEVDGKEVSLERLKDSYNEAEVRKIYKLSDVEVKQPSLVDSIVSRIATKDVI